jgi:hypothetical protein
MPFRYLSRPEKAVIQENIVLIDWRGGISNIPQKSFCCRAEAICSCKWLHGLWGVFEVPEITA